ncbi:MAG: SLBB domain-containing protein [Verrucomicrobiota bacterium]
MIPKLKGILPAAAAIVLAPALLFLTGCGTSSGPVFKETAAAGNPAIAENAAAPGQDAVAPGMTRPGPPAALDPALLKPPADPYRVGPGDILEIELIGGPDGPQNTFVGPDGKIYFNLLSGLQVWGYTLDETRRALEHGLSEFLQNPQVSLTLRGVHSRRVQVVGRVNTPGLYELSQPMTVLEAISQARGIATSRLSGATEEIADLQHSFLMRQGKMIPVDFERLIRQGDTSQNVYLQADDMIFLPSTMGSQIYVLGAVNQPRSVPFKGRPTLITALAACRGLTPDAKAKHVAIVRGSLRNPSVAIIDANAILRGKKPDILLSARDIVYVPARPPASLRTYIDLVVTTFARSLAASEAAAVTGSDQPVGLSLGIP